MKKVLFLILVIVILLGGFWYRAQAKKCPDSDNDGLNDCKERTVYFTEQFSPDTDGDGFFDGEEVERGFSPTHGAGVKINEIDSDGDGLFDNKEVEYGTSLAKFDTDGDGVNDFAEVDKGSDPLDPNSVEKSKKWYQFYK